MNGVAVDERRLVIGLDYGTTYTGESSHWTMSLFGTSLTSPGVAFATPSSNEARLNEIDLVDNWGPRMENHKKIPSVISFTAPTSKKEQQWGCDLSEDAMAMIHTKLQLDLLDVAGELDQILHSLEGMDDLKFDHIKEAGALPSYTDKSPQEVVTEYLSKVFKSFSDTIEEFSMELRLRIPVDIVVTVPTVRRASLCSDVDKRLCS